MDPQRCPFCHLDQSRIGLEEDAAVALPDAFPVAEGHMLVVPTRHVASLFELPDKELAAIWRLVAEVRGKLAMELKPDGRTPTLTSEPVLPTRCAKRANPRLRHCWGR